MNDQSSEDQKLNEFLGQTPTTNDPAEFRELEAGRADEPVMEKLARGQRNWYGSGALVVILLVGGLFAFRFVVTIFMPRAPGEGRNGFLDLGIALFAMMLAFLVYSNSKQH